MVARSKKEVSEPAVEVLTDEQLNHVVLEARGNPLGRASSIKAYENAINDWESFNDTVIAKGTDAAFKSAQDINSLFQKKFLRSVEIAFNSCASQQEQRILFDAILSIFNKHSVSGVVVDAELGEQKPESTQPALTTQARAKKTKTQLPVLPEGLSWPTDRFSKAPRGMGIVEFLENTTWPLLIEAGFGQRRYLAIVDVSAARGITNYERPNPRSKERRRLPAHLHFLTEREVTDQRLIEGGGSAIRTDGRLGAVVATRIKRGTRIPSFK